MTVQQPPPSARPMGVTILAILAAIGGVLGLLGGIALVGLGGLAGATTGNAGLGGLVSIFGLFLVVQAVLSLAFAYGAWTLKPWAWTLGMAVAILGIVGAVLGFVNDSNQLVSTIISIAIDAVIIYYLNTPAVKAAFRRA
jgi:hypothetical protein